MTVLGGVPAGAVLCLLNDFHPQLVDLSYVSKIKEIVLASRKYNKKEYLKTSVRKLYVKYDLVLCFSVEQYFPQLMENQYAYVLLFFFLWLE